MGHDDWLRRLGNGLADLGPNATLTSFVGEVETLIGVMTTRPPIPYTEMSIVRTLKHHLRGLLVAVAALSISASAVFAATAHSGNGPADAASDGLKRAAEKTESIIPNGPDQTVKDADDEDTDVETIESVTAGDKATKATKATKAVKAVKAADRPVNHGWYVSLAAKAATPAGFDSHGAYVSSIAKGDLGKPTSATSATDATEQSAKGQATATAAKAKAARQP